MMIITDDCNACIDECPSNAIIGAGIEFELNGTVNAAISDENPYVVGELCDDCRACLEVCPVESIIEA